MKPKSINTKKFRSNIGKRQVGKLLKKFNGKVLKIAHLPKLEEDTKNLISQQPWITKWQLINLFKRRLRGKRTQKNIPFTYKRTKQGDSYTERQTFLFTEREKMRLRKQKMSRAINLLLMKTDATVISTDSSASETIEYRTFLINYPFEDATFSEHLK